MPRNKKGKTHTKKTNGRQNILAEVIFENTWNDEKQVMYWNLNHWWSTIQTLSKQTHHNNVKVSINKGGKTTEGGGQNETEAARPHSHLYIYHFRRSLYLEYDRWLGHGMRHELKQRRTTTQGSIMKVQLIALRHSFY